MNKNWHRVFLMGLLLVLAACGGQAIPTVTPEPTAPAGSNGEAEPVNCAGPFQGLPVPGSRVVVNAGPEGNSRQCLHTFLTVGRCRVLVYTGTTWTVAEMATTAVCEDPVQAVAWWQASSYYQEGLDCSAQPGATLAGGTICRQPNVGTMLITEGTAQDCMVFTLCGENTWLGTAQPPAWCGQCGEVGRPACAEVVNWAQALCGTVH